MSPLFSILLLALVAMTSAADEAIISNQDSLTLELLSHADTPIFGDPGKLLKLDFTLKSKSESGTFAVSQLSDHDSFQGTITPTQITVQPNKIQTITVNNLIVPSTVKVGSKVSYTLKVTRYGGQMNQLVTEVSKTVLITVGPLKVDTTKPTVTSKYGEGCKVARNDSQCASQQWRVEFQVQDTESGLQRVELNAAGRDSIVFPIRYSYPNFAVATNDKISVSSDISCCIQEVIFKALDVAGVEAVVTALQGNSAGVLGSAGIFATLFIACTMLLMK